MWREGGEGGGGEGRGGGGGDGGGDGGEEVVKEEVVKEEVVEEGEGEKEQLIYFNQIIPLLCRPSFLQERQKCNLMEDRTVQYYMQYVDI